MSSQPSLINLNAVERLLLVRLLRVVSKNTPNQSVKQAFLPLHQLLHKVFIADLDGLSPAPNHLDGSEEVIPAIINASWPSTGKAIGSPFLLHN